MNLIYEQKLQEVYTQLGDHPKMVLATSNHDIVSARSMSFLIKDDIFYSQTDMTFRKYQDILNNTNVALCLDNIQIEGSCEDIGHPLDTTYFADNFKAYFTSSFESYSSLTNERLFAIKPTFIQRWNYIDGRPIIQTFNIKRKELKELDYVGE